MPGRWTSRLHHALCLQKIRLIRRCALYARNLLSGRRVKRNDLISVSSITLTPCSPASFTIWRLRNTKNISMIIRDIPAAQTRTSRSASAIEISIALRARAQISRKCSTITATANSPGPRRTLSLRWRSLKKITPRRFRFFIVPPRNRRNRRLSFPRAISKRVAWKYSGARRKPLISTCRLPIPEIKIRIAKTRA